MKIQFLLGTLLGDACIGKLYGRAKSYTIMWEHCLEQEEYALWKAHNCLDNYSFYKRDRLDSRTGKIYHSVVCYSKKDNYQYYRELFYADKKEVSQEVLDKLEPLAIAIWFMDDGNVYYNGNNCHLTLSINGFNDESADRIILYFRNKYNLNFKKTGRGIRLTSNVEVLKFESYFRHYYHSSMEYKTLTFQKEKYKNEKRKK